MQMSDRIGRRIKLHEIHVLMAVVQAGSMRKAATLLNTTQSAVSRSIAELEQATGVRLLDRNSQGIEPTRYGRVLLKRGIVVFDELKQGVKEIEFLNDPSAGELWIGSSLASSEGIVLAVVERLSRQFPRVAFHVVPLGTPALYAELRERRIELAFTAISRSAPENDIDQEWLFEDPPLVVAGLNNPWTRRRKLKLAELVNEPWTWAAQGTLIDSLVVEAFRASGLEPPRATVYSDAINMRIRLAATGGFLAIVSASIMRFPSKHALLKVLPVNIPTTQRLTTIITLKSRTLSPLAQRFIECARELAKPLEKGRS